tara:strand:+ start:376 stop:609 length:234 start_codon:yes stop_codon:yes gene_type:complete
LLFIVAGTLVVELTESEGKANLYTLVDMLDCDRYPATPGFEKPPCPPVLAGELVVVLTESEGKAHLYIVDVLLALEK